ncbi:MAG: hypothetical protein ACK46X_16365, partial [Candidatus Sericytochromatia bacterium]
MRNDEWTLTAKIQAPGLSPAAPARVVRVAETAMPTAWGDFRIVGYRLEPDGTDHVALVMGDPTLPGTLVRVHSECLTGDAFGSMR